MINEIARRMLELGSDLQRMEASEALAFLDKQLADEADAEFAWEMRISKAKLLSSIGYCQEAVDLLDECSSAPCANESAAYFAAEILVERGRFSEAIEFLEKAERQIERSGAAYYRDCIFLLHAFCEARQGEAERAMQLLEEVTDDDESLFWLKTDLVISVTSVRNLIASRY